MRATTLLIPEELHAQLREEAARRGVSLGELMRRAATRELRGKAARTPSRRRGRLPASVWAFMAAPAGAFRGLGLRGRPGEPEDPYADVD